MRGKGLLAAGVAVALVSCSPSPGSLGDDQFGTSTDGGSTTTTTSSNEATSTTASETSTGGVKYDVGSDTEGDDDTIPDAPEFPTTCEEAARSLTSVGCEFYPLALPQGQGQGNTGFAVNNVSNTPATVTLSDVAGLVDSATVQPGATHMFSVDGTRQLLMLTEITQNGYVIDSNQPLQVYQFSPPASTVTADASIVLPRQALGTRHRVVAYNDHNSTSANGLGNQYAAIVAIEDETEVTFTLSLPGSFSFGGNGIPELDKDNGIDTFTVTLDRLQTLSIAVPNEDQETEAYNVEITGSLVETDKPVAVYSGNKPTGVPGIYPWPCCADLISTAVPPTTVYGKQYAGVKLLPLGLEKDVWRFVGNRDGTEIVLSGGLDDVIALDAGEFWDINADQVFWAKGNHPFGVIHFMTGSDLVQLPNGLDTYDCGNIPTPGDPALAWVMPAGNWLNRYLFPVGPVDFGEWCHDHVNIVAPTEHWGAITLDGMPLEAATAIGSSDYSYVRMPVPKDSYELLAPPGVGVEILVYGYVDDGSYLYPGGLGLQKLNAEG